MARLEFTAQLQRFGLPLPQLEAPAARLSELLELGFAESPRLRAYVLDEQGGLRAHVAVFIDGRRSLDMNAALRPDSRVFVLQALSGG